jgi:hypothetical protein
MSEYELIDAFTSLVSIMQGSLTLYLSVITGYLVLAFVVGEKLTRFQVVIISILFIIFAGGFLVGSQNHMSELIKLGVEIRAMGREGFGESYTANTTLFNLVVDLFGIFASLAFMIQSRKPKASPREIR